MISRGHDGAEKTKVPHDRQQRCGVFVRNFQYKDVASRALAPTTQFAEWVSPCKFLIMNHDSCKRNYFLTNPLQNGSCFSCFYTSEMQFRINIALTNVLLGLLLSGRAF